MRVTDEVLETVRTRGFAIVEGFLDAAEVDAARTGLFQEFPTPDDYFADPDAHRQLVESQFSAIKIAPYRSWELNRIAFHPDLVDAAERFCGTTHLQLYKIELWAKYSGSVDYDQDLHRDYGNHNLVVPRRDGRWPQLTSFTLLSDVTEHDGPTRVVPRAAGDGLPFTPQKLPMDSLAEHQVSVTGPAGTLFLYTTEVWHRGSAMTGEHRSRFALLADYSERGNPWMGRVAWPTMALRPGWIELIERASVRERDLFGFPPPGHEYWNEQTLADVHARYPGMDIAPYAG